MSKSLNNFFTARDILKEYDSEAIRFFFLSKHYRSPIDFNREIIQESETAVNNFYTALKAIEFKEDEFSGSYSDIILEKEQAFTEAMDDDFNTAKAISVLFDLTKIVRSTKEKMNIRQEAGDLLVKLGKVLGFFADLETKLSNDLGSLSEKLLQLLIDVRLEAKQSKNWSLSDMIRDGLLKEGIQLLDSKEGTKWEKK